MLDLHLLEQQVGHKPPKLGVLLFELAIRVAFSSVVADACSLCAGAAFT